MKRRAYPKPQTLNDWHSYRLSDLCEFFTLPEHERAVMLWGFDNYGISIEYRSSANAKIGTEWFIQAIQFRRRYAEHKRRGHFEKTIQELEAHRAAEGKR
jgi:hypothetical protein